MQHFKYTDTIRRPDGTLRPWEEYNILSKYEMMSSWSPIGRFREEIDIIKKAKEIIKNER